MNLLAIGTDSEYFVTKNNEVDCVIGLIGGSKDEPVWVEKGNLQEDNILAEFAIDPAFSAKEFLANIRSVETALFAALDSKGVGIVRQSSYEFPLTQLMSWGDQAMTLGCSPDFNAYTECDNPRPNGMNTLRTAAGHVHFSYDNPDEDVTCAIVKTMDYLLGVWSVLRDPDTARRALYGKAGSCRIKPYGGEYRVLGNFWLEDDSDVEFVYHMTQIAVEKHELLLPMLEQLANANTIQGVINQHNKPMAETLYPLIQKVVETHYAELLK